ncbi:hypothetical protein ABEF95_005642 [Exophiala dermatitidis]
MAAGHDLNKIVRADYGDLLYMKLALKTLAVLRADPLYSQHFRNNGYLYSYDKEFLNKIMTSWEHFFGKGNAQSYLLSPEEARKRYNGVFEDADSSMVEQCLYSPTAGWADSAAALESVMQAAVDLGVKYVASGVAKLLFGEQGDCVGAETEGGRTLTADRTILAAGAWIPLILAETEVIPPGDKRLLKRTYDTGFSNNAYHEKSGQKMSLPSTKTSRSTWSQDIPEVLKDNLKTVKNELFGGWVDKVEPESYRLCWDGFTQKQDWLIYPHPKSETLFIVGGGSSFHGFKFLPMIGDLVVQMLRGELDEEMTRRWAWDGPREGAICPSYIPGKDLADLVDDKPDQPDADTKDLEAEFAKL